MATMMMQGAQSVQRYRCSERDDPVGALADRLRGWPGRRIFPTKHSPLLSLISLRRPYSYESDMSRI